MPDKIAFLSNSLEYGGPAAIAKLTSLGWLVFCHDDSFVSEEARVRFEQARPELVASRAGDVADFVAEGVARFGRIDALISNDIPKPLATVMQPRSATSDRLEDFEQALGAMAVEPVRLLRGALPVMKAARSGSIIFITSGAPLRVPSIGGWSYGYLAARAAINSLARGLATELAPLNIQVNAIAPYGVYSATFYPSDQGADDPRYAAVAANFTPMARFGREEELGELIGTLTSGAMTFVTGQVIAISGAAC